MKVEQLLETAIQASVKAGEEILKVYNSSIHVELKDDKSPLTEADKKSHQAIVSFLNNTQIPILSEEGKSIDYHERKNWNLFWCVDPLDGTKEFIKRNGEFTVNIALISNGNPIAGVIYVPVKKTLYFSSETIGAHKVTLSKEMRLELVDLVRVSQKLPSKKETDAYVVVASRSHMSPETEEFVETLKKKHEKIEITSMGSSLKLCLVAEGKADVYPRFAPTMEWDTAAGQAIAQGAGKKVINHTTGNPLDYNKENLLNNWFIVQ